VNIYLASRSSLLKPINERIVNIDGSNSINVGNYDAKDLRIKISSAISKMKDNEASKGGNPTKRILLSTNLNQDEWEKIVKNNSEYSVPDDDKLPEESAFNPNDIEDGIEKIIRAITLRRGQSKFRQKLIKAYNGKCAITQSMVLPTLQAAHIYPYKGDETNHITNGILLRSDVHDLFDLHLIGINEDYEIIISEELIGSEYEVYNGKEILLPKEHSEFPSKLSLKLRPIPKRIL